MPRHVDALQRKTVTMPTAAETPELEENRWIVGTCLGYDDHTARLMCLFSSAYRVPSTA